MVTHPAAVSGILFKLGETVRSSMIVELRGVIVLLIDRNGKRGRRVVRPPPTFTVCPRLGGDVD